MKTKTLGVALAVMTVLGSCRSNDDALPTSKYITVSASVGAMSRTVTDGLITTFVPGDRIGVYAWMGSSTSIAAPFAVNGVTNVLQTDQNSWKPEAAMLWADMDTPHYFMGVYPAHTITNFTADAYTLDTDKQDESDLLVATNLNGLRAESTVGGVVSLAFSHVMAKLVVNLTYRSQFGGIPTVESVQCAATPEATIDYLTATATAVAQSGVAVSLPAVTADTQFASVMVPQEGFRSVSIQIEGRSYTYTHPTDIPLVKGRITTLNLTVGRESIEIGGISVNDWTEGEIIDGGEALD